MGGLSRIALVIFIFYAIGFWTLSAAKDSEGAQIMAIVSIVLAILFVSLGWAEDKP